MAEVKVPGAEITLSKSKLPGGT